MNHNEANKLWRRLRRQGYTVESTAGNHIRITHPNMTKTVFAPSTPSDIASLRNVAAKLKRAIRRPLT